VAATAEPRRASLPGPQDAILALSRATTGRLDAFGIQPAAKSPEEFAQSVRLELKRRAKLLKAAGFVLQESTAGRQYCAVGSTSGQGTIKLPQAHEKMSGR